VFGQSENSGTVLVYDESWVWPNSSNYNGDGTFFLQQRCDPTTQSWPNNDNTGTGAGGEVNEFTITVAGDLVNVQMVNQAVAATNNDDFTNKSTACVTAGTAPDGAILML